ncbi:hypothetical protein ACWKSP_23805 [Micromonosporaceae bacterium Da 78-11]
MGLFRKTMSVGTLGMIGFRNEDEKTAVHRRRQRRHMGREFDELQKANRIAAEQLALAQAGSGIEAEPVPERKRSALERAADRVEAKNRARAEARKASSE